MRGTDRRSTRRYVIDGLLVEIAGVDHETVDISTRSVAVVRSPGIDYKKLTAPFRFKSRKGDAIDHTVSALKIVRERAATIVFEYRPTRRDWAATLARYDVRAGVAALEDVFG